MNLVIMGPPGCGKGTQAEILVAKYGVTHISTGDMLRAAVKSGSELGQRVEAVMAAGDLVSDDLMMEIIEDRLQQEDTAGGWLLDGFPRTVAQAEGLAALLAGIDRTIDGVISVMVPDEEILRRLGGRLTCDACGQVTNQAKLEATGSKTCPNCGEEALRQRKDDQEETIRHRLEVFRTQTDPAAESLGKAFVHWKIDGMGAPEDVTQRIASALD
mgnify:CR=1 FL=1